MTRDRDLIELALRHAWRRPMKIPKRWALTALLLTGLGSRLMQIAQGQVYSFPEAPSSIEATPSLDDFRALQQRLLATEQRLDALSQQHDEFISLPAPESDASIEK